MLSVLKDSFENRVAENSLQPYYFWFLYSDGVIPVYFLKTRQKYCNEEKPLCKAHSSKVKNEYFIRLFAFFNLTDMIYCDGER
jgi:hypothetical protein